MASHVNDNKIVFMVIVIRERKEKIQNNLNDCS